MNLEVGHGFLGFPRNLRLCELCRWAFSFNWRSVLEDSRELLLRQRQDVFAWSLNSSPSIFARSLLENRYVKNALAPHRKGMKLIFPALVWRSAV